MADRIRLDDLTSNQLDALYARAEGAEQQLATVRAIEPYSLPTAGDRSVGYRMGWDACLTAVQAALERPAERARQDGHARPCDAATGTGDPGPTDSGNDAQAGVQPRCPACGAPKPHSTYL